MLMDGRRAMADGVPIMLGSMKGISTVLADPELVRGEEGPTNPQLVLPLEFAIPSEPSGPMYAVASLKAWLGTDPTVWPHSAVCPPAVQLLVGSSQGFAAHSLPNNQKGKVDLRFFLAAAQVEALEEKRTRLAGRL
jgi:hypothetical protein